MTPSNNADPKPSTCVSIGCVTGFVKTNLSYTGAAAPTTLQATFTNHYSPLHHRLMRSQYIYTGPPPDPASAAHASTATLAPDSCARIPFTPVPLSLLGEGVLRNYLSTAGFQSLLTQSVILSADLRPSVTFADPIINCWFIDFHYSYWPNEFINRVSTSIYTLAARFDRPLCAMCICCEFVQ